MSPRAWRPVVGNEVTHEVSSRGDIRAVYYTPTPGGVKRSTTPLDQSVLDPDYRGVRIAGQLRRVHLLVLEAFVGPRPFPEAEARHLNGKSADNAWSNLAWGTHAENMADMLRHGVHNHARKERCARAGHLLEPPNLQRGMATRGHRKCRSCSYGDSTAASAAKQGRPLDRGGVASLMYDHLMHGGPHPRARPELLEALQIDEEVTDRQPRRGANGALTTMEAVLAAFGPGDVFTTAEAMQVVTDAGALTSYRTVVTTLTRGIGRGLFTRHGRGRYERLPEQVRPQQGRTQKRREPVPWQGTCAECEETFLSRATRAFYCSRRCQRAGAKRKREESRS